MSNNCRHMYKTYFWIYYKRERSTSRDCKQILKQHGLTKGDVRVIPTNQGGELARSSNFRAMVASKNYILEMTGSNATSENRTAEKPNQTLAALVRRLLYNAGLLPTYWADEFLHAVYLYNPMT